MMHRGGQEDIWGTRRKEGGAEAEEIGETNTNYSTKVIHKIV